MIRTQVYLENQTHKDLLLLAQMEHKPMAEVTRDILREGIQKRKTVDTTGVKAMLAIAHTNLRSVLQH